MGTNYFNTLPLRLQLEEPFPVPVSWTPRNSNGV